MRAHRVLALLTVGCASAALLTATSGAAAGGFAGSWVATDTLDGSSLSLSIRSGGTHYAVREVDAAGSVCGGAPAAVAGAGTARGDTLFVSGTLTCMPGGNILRERIGISFSHSSANDTLTDNDGVVWHRSS